jgi:hypothetical protein
LKAPILFNLFTFFIKIFVECFSSWNHHFSIATTLLFSSWKSQSCISVTTKMQSLVLPPKMMKKNSKINHFSLRRATFQWREVSITFFLVRFFQA